MKKGSIPGHEHISENSQKGLDLRDVYQLTLTNTSKLNVTARDKKIGAIILVPNVPFTWNGHPEYPFDVSFEFSFLEAGETNSVTATYLRSYGNT